MRSTLEDVRSMEGLGLSAPLCPGMHATAPRDDLLAGLSVRQSRRDMHLQPFGGAGAAMLHIALGTVNVVPKYMQSRPISLRLNRHEFLRL